MGSNETHQVRIEKTRQAPLGGFQAQECVAYVDGAGDRALLQRRLSADPTHGRSSLSWSSPGPDGRPLLQEGGHALAGVG